MDRAPQAGVEKQVPAGMMVVVVNVNLVAIPLPVAAAAGIVRGHHPIGIVVQKDVPSAGIKAARDVDFPHVFVAAARIGTAGADAIMIGIPIAIVVTVVLVPTLMLAIVAAIVVITVAVFVPFMLTIVMTFVAVAAVVAILRRRGEREGASQ